MDRGVDKEQMKHSLGRWVDAYMDLCEESGKAVGWRGLCLVAAGVNGRKI